MMAGPNSIRYVLEVDDQGSPRLIRFGQAATSAGNQAQGSFSRTSKAMANLSLAGMGISAMMGKIASGTMAVVDAASKYDSLQVRLRGIEGGAKGASAAFERLQELSKLPGLGFEQATSAYAGLRSLRQDGPEAIAIIEAIARANASMGGGAEEFGRAMRQIQQIIGKGKLQAEDLNTISESIPNFRALMLDAFGTTDASVINAKYSMDEFLKGVVKVSKDLPPPAETIKNNIDNMSDSWTRLMASFANNDAIKSATSKLSALLETLAKANEADTEAKTAMKSAGVSSGFWLNRIRHGNSNIAKEYARGIVNFGNPFGGVNIVSGLAGGPTLADLIPGLGMKTDERKLRDAIGTPGGLGTSQSESAASYAAYMAGAKSGARQSMDEATGKKGANDAKGRDVNVDFWATGADLGATRADWNNRRGVDRDLADRRRQAAKEEADAIAEISEKEIAFYREIQDQKAEIVRENTERIQGYYVDLAQSSSSVLAQSFAQIGDGFGAMTDAMLAGFKNMMIQMAAEVAANAVVFGVLNLFSGGAAGTFAKGFSGLSGLLMGHAMGGGVGSGEASIIGERRAEIFVPRSSGRIEPTATSANQSITIVVRNPAEAQSTARALRRDARQRNTGLA